MKKKIFNSEILIRKTNKFCAKDFEIFKEESLKKIKPSYLHYLNNVKVLPEGNICINFDIKIICDFLKINSISKFKILKLFILLLNYFLGMIRFFIVVRKYEEVDCAYIIHDRHSKNYFHWVCDVLPKICLNKKIFNQKYPLILPKFKTKFQKESLNLLGITNIKEMGNDIINIKKVLYISELYPSGNPRPDIFKHFRNKVLKKIKPSLIKNRKIYVSRKFAKRRRLIDQNILEKKLRKIGFEIHNFENYSFFKQVKLSSESKLMTGVSGAGLINLIWMRPGSKVIDIRPRDKTLNGFFVMADIFNINYEYYWCEFKNFIRNATHSDYKISINNFLKTISKKFIK